MARIYSRSYKPFYRAIIRDLEIELWYTGSGKDITILVAATFQDALLIATNLARIVDY